MNVLYSIKKAYRKIINVVTQQTIQKKLFSSSVLLILSVLSILFFISYGLLSNLIIERQADYDLNTYKQVDSYLKFYFGNIDSAVQKAVREQELHSCLSKDMNHKDYADIYDRVSFMDTIVKESFDIDKYIENIIIMGKNNFTYQYAQGGQGRYLGDGVSYEKYFSSEGSFLENYSFGKPIYNIELTSSNLEEKDFTRLLQNKLIYAKPLRNTHNNETGVIIFILNSDLFQYVFSNTPKEQKLLLVNHNEQLIWSNQKEVPYQKYGYLSEKNKDYGYIIKTVDSGNYICEYYNFPNYSFQLYSEMPVDKVINQNRSNELKMYTLTYAIACFLFVLLVSYFFSKMISKPIHEFAQMISGDINYLLTHNIKLKKFVGINKQMRFKILLYFIVTVIMPALIFTTLMTYKYFIVYKEKVMLYTTNSIKLAKWNIDYHIKSYDSITQQIIFSESVQELLNSTNHTSQSRNLSQVEKIYNDVRANKKELLSLNIYNTEGEVIYSSNNQNNALITNISKDFFTKIKYNKGKFILLEADVDFNFYPVLIFSRVIRSNNEENFGKTQGYLTCSIDKDLFYNLLQKLKTKGTQYHYYLMDNQGNIIVEDSNAITFTQLNAENYRKIMSNTGSGFITEKKNKEENLIFYDTICNNELKILEIIPIKEIKSKIYPLLLYNLILIIVSLIIIIMISSLVSASITKPLDRLKNIMARVNDGNLDISFQYKGRDEIAVLTEQFNNMLKRINELIVENYQAKLRESELSTLQTEAQLSALQQQINPHFLYNTLEAIKWIAYWNGITQICEITTALGKFFRGSISKGNNLISFGEELDHLDSYIYIQKVRYQDKLVIRKEVEEDVKAYKTVKLILQPLVENAINHGVDSMESGAVIIIRGFIELDSIIFEIEDNGVGMTKERLEEVKELCFSSDGGTGNLNIGMNNVYKRLKLRLGDQCDFQLFSEEGNGTTVRLVIPKIL